MKDGRVRRGMNAFSWVGVGVLAVLLPIAILGSVIAPHEEGASIGLPYEQPTREAPLGTDKLGRDVLSRVLHGGRPVVLLAALSTLTALVAGASLGLLIGYVDNWAGGLAMRLLDALIALPAILILLILVTGLGRGTTVIIVAVAATTVPFVTRNARAATLQVVRSPFIEAAVARGERTHSILVRELLPNVVGPILADGGLRFVGSIYLVAAASFLGFGPQPPSADWALMVSENRIGLTLQPWAVAAPAILIVLLVVSTNLVVDFLHSRLTGRAEDSPVPLDASRTPIA